MWNSIRVRLSLIFAGLAIIPLIAVGIIMLQSTYVAVRAQAIALQGQVAQNAGSAITDYFRGVNQDLLNLADQLGGESEPSRTTYTIMISGELNFASYGKDLAEITLLDPQGREIVRASHQGVVPENQLLDHSKLEDYLQPARTRQAYYGPPTVDPTTGQSYLTLSIPLLTPGNPSTAQLSGVLVGKVWLAPLDDLLAKTLPGQSQTLYLTDAAGNVVAHQDPSFNLKNAHVALPEAAALQTGLDHSNVVLAVNKVQLGNETLNAVAEKPTSDALALVTNLSATVIIAALIALLLSAAAGLGFVRQIVLPIENLAATAKQIAGGDLSQTVSVRSRDEIGILANAFNDMTSQLRNLVASLEKRVSERTQELERETLSVRTAAEIARDIASIEDLDELLASAGQLIVERFKFYHAGIFLLDDKKEYAVLRASPTAAGKQLIANGHRLRVGEQGIVGRVAATGEARIALDTGADAVYFNNPFLPTTRSEMALPLKVGSEILGILDIQSDQPQAFTREDIEILQVMADQLAIAIERMHLLAQVRDQLSEIEQAYQEATQRSWQSFTRNQTRIAGYKFDGTQLQPLAAPPATSETPGGKPGSNPDFQAIPIRLRGQTLGFVNVRFRGNGASSETTALIEQIADRLAAALENARLNEETRQRAQRERAIAELSTKISTFSDVDSIMRSAVEELGHRLGSSTEVTLELGDGDQESHHD